MKKILISLFALSFLVACTPGREVVQIVQGKDGAPGADGKDGTSCSVAPEYALSPESEDSPAEIIGARISCTDGSYAIVLNGPQGSQGVQGPQGDQGIQGPVGQTGATGASCQAYRSSHYDGVWLSCPHQSPVLISDGKDGRDGQDGQDGQSCSSERQSSQSRVKITCGHTVTYVYDGEDGTNGTNGHNGTNGTNGTNGSSCTVTPVSGGASVKCGNGTPVFLANGSPGAAGTTGPAGPQGQPGAPGRDGLNGQNGEDAVQPGLSCSVHDLRSWDGNTSLPAALANNPSVGSFILPNFSVPDSQASLGFPGLPANLRAIVGDEGYAFDCNGYLNTPDSGQWTLSLLSDDGSYLSIEDGYFNIQNQGLHAPQSVSNTGNLNRGQNKINVVYYQGPYTQIALQLSWSGPNTASQVIPASQFTH